MTKITLKNRGIGPNVSPDTFRSVRFRSGSFGSLGICLLEKAPKIALTDTAIRSAKSAAKRFKLGDAGGLFLLVTPQGGKLWRVEFRHRCHPFAPPPPCCDRSANSDRTKNQESTGLPTPWRRAVGPSRATHVVHGAGLVGSRRSLSYRRDAQKSSEDQRSFPTPSAFASFDLTFISSVTSGLRSISEAPLNFIQCLSVSLNIESS